MVDVRLLYPLEKTEAAARLADALAAAGYRVEREGLADGRAFPDIAAEAGKAKALLLIWSRGLVSAAMAGTALASARRLPNLVEVSADGIEPAGTEASPVILLSGWRGQPYHQGWRRILDEVGRLCGPRAAPAASLRRVASGAGASGGAGGPKAKRLPVRAAVAAGALIAVTLAAGALYERGAGDPGPDAAPRAPVAAAASPARPEAAEIAAASAPSAPVAPEPRAQAETAAMETGPAPAAPRSAAPAVKAERAAQGRPAAQRRSARSSLAAASASEVKRYSRKHSKTMRLFCQRSGRSTPQCRTFARSVRDRDG